MIIFTFYSIQYCDAWAESTAGGRGYDAAAIKLFFNHSAMQSLCKFYWLQERERKKVLRKTAHSGNACFSNITAHLFLSLSLSLLRSILSSPIPPGLVLMTSSVAPQHGFVQNIVLPFLTVCKSRTPINKEVQEEK